MITGNGSGTKTRIRVLVLEDRASEAELNVHELRRAGFDPVWECVQTEADFVARLDPALDLILADYQLPQFDGLSAIELARARVPGVPIIIISGSLGDETAVDCIKRGATDYVLKDRMARLGLAVTQALNSTRLRAEQEQTRQALHASEALFSKAFRSSPVALAISRMSDHVIMEVNAAFALLFDCPREEAVGRTAEQLGLIEAGALEHFRTARREQGSLHNYELTMRDRRDGKHEIIVSSEIVSVSGEACALTTLVDITQRKRSEAALRENERFLHAALDGLTAHIAIVDEQGVILAVNQSWGEFAASNGLPWARGGEGANYLEVCDRARGPRAEDSAAVAAAIREVLQRKRVLYEAEYPCHSPTEERWFMVRVTPFPGDGPRRAVVAHENITRRRLQQEALRSSEERFRQIAENIQEVFWMTDPAKDRLLYVSPAYEKIWGRTCASLPESALAWTAYVCAEDRARVVQAVMTKQMAGTYDETYRVMRPDGSIRWVRDRAFPIRDGQGVVRRVVGVAEDISERKKLEEQFLRAQRLEAIGTLSSGIAHDLNNLLAPMLMVGALLKEKLPDPHDRTLLALVEQGAQRGAGIIKQLLTFSRGIGGDRGIVQLRYLVKEMGGIMRETFPREIAIAEAVDSDLWPVVADATQLHQVLMNLCVNARDAMPAGGTLRLAASNLTLGAGEAVPHPEAKPGHFAVLTVADSGHGIPREIIDRIFEPFFTTKEIGKGTGLGLSTVLGIVRSHGGFVVVDSEPGHGTSFRVFLPAAAEADRAAPTPASAHGLLPGGEQQVILVVDDEEAIRATLRQLLEHHHYRVMTAGHGGEALEVLEQQGANVRLVLTDVMMPVMGGIPLIRAARALLPTLKIIATTGLDDQGRRAELTALGVSEILMKPFNATEALEALRRQLPTAS